MSPGDGTQTGKLSEFSLKRRITVLVMVMTALVVGAVAMNRIPVELFPRGFEDPSMWIVARVAGESGSPRWLTTTPLRSTAITQTSGSGAEISSARAGPAKQIAIASGTTTARIRPPSGRAMRHRTHSDTRWARSPRRRVPRPA